MGIQGGQNFDDIEGEGKRVLRGGVLQVPETHPYLAEAGCVQINANFGQLTLCQTICPAENWVSTLW
jgi:hypothetical protein